MFKAIHDYENDTLRIPHNDGWRILSCCSVTLRVLGAWGSCGVNRSKRTHGVIFTVTHTVASAFTHIPSTTPAPPSIHPQWDGCFSALSQDPCQLGLPLLKKQNGVAMLLLFESSI